MIPRAARVIAAATLAALAVSAVATPAIGADEWLAQPVDDATYRTYLEFFEYARDRPLRTEVAGTSTQDGVHSQRLSFESTPGVRVTALVYRIGSETPAPAIVLLHGGGALGKDLPGNLAYAERLARVGFVVLAMDLLHYGERKTDLLETFSMQEKAERLYSEGSTYLAWVTQTVKDVGRSIDLLLERESVDPDRIILVGTSRGGVLGTIVAAAETRLAGAAILYAGHAGSWASIEHPGAACPANYIGRIAPRPLLMINGNDDQIFRKQTAVLPLQTLAGEGAEIVWLDTGHTTAGEEQAANLFRWLAARFDTR